MGRATNKVDIQKVGLRTMKWTHNKADVNQRVGVPLMTGAAVTRAKPALR